MARRVLFQMHWLLGITAGLVLAVMGVTGATLSFETEIRAALSPRLIAPGIPAAPDLDPDRLIARIEAGHPGFTVARLDWETARARSHAVRLLATSGRGREEGRVDRATGAWLGEPAGAGVFDTVEHLHRWLALPGEGNGVGRQITGFAALALVFFALSGLYLRWPRRPLDWRAWLVLDTRKTGRNLWRALHAVIGTWVCLFYLLSAGTGLWWSYDWYRRGVGAALGARVEGEAKPRASGAVAAARPAIDPAWRTFSRDERAHYAWVRITRPPRTQPMTSIVFEARRADARHDRQTDRFTYAPDGTALGRDLYDRRSLGKIVTQSMFELHRGAFFGLPGRIAMLLTSLTMPLFTVTGLMLYLSRRGRRRAGTLPVSSAGAAIGPAGTVLVAYASQTGRAERHAHDAAAALVRGGIAATVLPLSRLTPALLDEARVALFIVSTYGEGAAPDTARRFERAMMRRSVALPALRYGLLCLGDREYPDFCAFGRRVGAWLDQAGARRLFEPVELDGEDAAGLAVWTDALAAMGARGAGQAAPRFAPWRLEARAPLNPHSPCAPAFHLRLRPVAAAMPAWEAGDIAEILPGVPAPAPARTLRVAAGAGGAAGIEDADAPATALPEGVREYSAASLPEDGALDLVVRQHRRADGALGLGSGLLTERLAVGETVMLRMRANPGFRRAPGGGRMILIGNGTGIAGLRAHLRAAALRGERGHWLFFGERHRAHEAYFDTEIAGWLSDGTLARAERAFSRDPACGRYVQHLVAGAGGALVRAVEAGATLMVCGSLEGMGQAVHAALGGLLGEDRLDVLAEQGRYRRDVY